MEKEELAELKNDRTLNQIELVGNGRVLDLRIQRILKYIQISVITIVQIIYSGDIQR